MVAPIFSYTDCMNTDETLNMAFEWKHTREDHLTVLEYRFLHTNISPFGVSARRRARVIIFLIFCIPLVLIFLYNINGQTAMSTAGAFGITAFIFWMLVIKKPKPEAIEASTKKLAKRYIDGANTIPIGMHELSTDGQLLDWRWIDGEEQSSYPISKIESICESGARLYFIRRGEAAESIPFHAFGDQETRLAFVELIKGHLSNEVE